MDRMFVSSIGGLDDFLVYLVISLALLALFIWVYIHITPYREIRLIRDGNTAAAASLSGALLGFTIPLASAVAHSVSLVDMLIWGAIALVVQLVAFVAARLLVPTLASDIPAGKTAQGIFVGVLSLAVGILNAACMTY